MCCALMACALLRIDYVSVISAGTEQLYTRGFKMMKQVQKGFTLIELMIVVAIIGILAAVAIPAYQDYVVKAKLAKVQSTLDPIKTALALYYQEQGAFPVGTVNSGQVPAAGNLWNSIGINGAVNIPTEVSLMTVTSAAPGTEVRITLALQNIKASGINGTNLVLRGNAGGTAILWSCDSSSTVTDAIAKKYFTCA